MKLFFVYNPMSGRGQIRNKLFDIINVFSEAGYEITVHPTRAPKDATAMVTELPDTYDLIVCSGGDGTMDEVVEGMMRRKKKLPLGYIPSGTVNDFARSLKIPRNMAHAAEVAVHGNDFICDVGSFNGSHLVYIAAFGIFTDVAYSTSQDVKNVLGFIGKPFLALTIATLAAMYFLGIKKGYTGAQLKKILDHSLRPVGMILLVIASGGVIRWMLQDSGLGDIIGPALEKSGMPLILVAFLIALLVRASVGSSMVAMTMASGIMATMPAVMATSMLYRAAMCCAICGGATALSHVNDAGFWLVGTFLEIDEKTTLKSWTIMETLIGITALIVSLIISIFA